MFSLVGIIAQSLLQYFDTVLWVTGRHPVGKNTVPLMLKALLLEDWEGEMR